MSFFSGDSASKLCEAVYYSDASPRENLGFRGGQSVFCKTEQVPRFFERLRLTRKRIVLVSGESDYACDRTLQRFLPPNVIHWFATNLTAEHPRVSAIPLGIGRAGDDVTPSEADLRAHFIAAPERRMSMYVNFRPETNEGARRGVYERFRGMSTGAWFTFREPSLQSSADFLREMTEHRFVLCPPGNGVDTHRFWETLATGGVPVVLSSATTRAFCDLPIVIVDSFEEVSRERLEREWERLAPVWARTEAVGVEFWRERIAAKLSGIEAWLSWSEYAGETMRYSGGMIARRIFGFNKE